MRIRYRRYQRRRDVPSRPCKSNCNCSGRRLQLAPAPVGHPNVPRSSENKQMAAQRILFQHRLHFGVKAIERTPHVDGIQCDKDSRRRRHAQHRGSPSNRAMSSTLSAWRDRIVHPCGLTTSIAQFESAAMPVETSGTSRNVTRFFLERPLLLRSHQSSVDFATPSLWQNARRV